jgi:hypothetical protein
MEGKVPLMVWCTCHHQTQLPASLVRLQPLRGAPLVHHLTPALATTKYMSYKKITVSVLNLRKNQYLPAGILLW